MLLLIKNVYCRMIGCAHIWRLPHLRIVSLSLVFDVILCFVHNGPTSNRLHTIELGVDQAMPSGLCNLSL